MIKEPWLAIISLKITSPVFVTEIEKAIKHAKIAFKGIFYVKLKARL
jgi:hypothetical protein